MDAAKGAEPLTGLKIPYTRLIDPEGRPVGPLSGFAQDPEALKVLYTPSRASVEGASLGEGE